MPAAPAAEGVPAPAEPVLTPEERAKVVRLQGDLVWLVREGYVTEFIDGRLFAPPPMVEARKKEIETEEHDPENFPEAPPVTETSENAPPAAETSTSPSPQVESPPPPASAEPPALDAESPVSNSGDS